MRPASSGRSSPPFRWLNAALRGAAEWRRSTVAMTGLGTTQLDQTKPALPSADTPFENGCSGPDALVSLRGSIRKREGAGLGVREARVVGYQLTHFGAESSGRFRRWGNLLLSE